MTLSQRSWCKQFTLIFLTGASITVNTVYWGSGTKLITTVSAWLSQAVYSVAHTQPVRGESIQFNTQEWHNLGCSYNKGYPRAVSVTVWISKTIKYQYFVISHLRMPSYAHNTPQLCKSHQPHVLSHPQYFPFYISLSEALCDLLLYNCPSWMVPQGDQMTSHNRDAGARARERT